MSVLSRRLAGVAALALSTTALSVAAPAHAGGTYETQVVLTGIDPDGNEFTEYPRASLTVVGAPPDMPFWGGTLVLQRRLNGQDGWVDLGVGDRAADDAYEWYLTEDGNAEYRVYYTGGTNGGVDPDTFAPSYSNSITVTMEHPDPVRQKVRGGKFFLVGKLDYFAGKRLKVQERLTKRGKWRTIKRVRTNDEGRYKVQVRGSRKGIYHRVVIPETPEFEKTVSKAWIAVDR